MISVRFDIFAIKCALTMKKKSLCLILSLNFWTMIEIWFVSNNYFFFTIKKRVTIYKKKILRRYAIHVFCNSKSPSEPLFLYPFMQVKKNQLGFEDD